MERGGLRSRRARARSADACRNANETSRTHGFGTPLRRLRIAALGVLAGAVGVLAFAGSAGAFETHLFEGSFGPDGTPETAFLTPAGVAADSSTRDVYVGQPFNGSNIEKFNAAHEPEAFTGKEPGVVEGKLSGYGHSPLLSQ